MEPSNARHIRLRETLAQSTRTHLGKPAPHGPHPMPQFRFAATVPSTQLHPAVGSGDDGLRTAPTQIDCDPTTRSASDNRSDPVSVGASSDAKVSNRVPTPIVAQDAFAASHVTPPLLPPLLYGLMHESLPSVPFTSTYSVQPGLQNADSHTVALSRTTHPMKAPAVNRDLCPDRPSHRGCSTVSAPSAIAPPPCPGVTDGMPSHRARQHNFIATISYFRPSTA